jgi:hypothetical protein
MTQYTMITLILFYSIFVFNEYRLMQRQFNSVQKCRAYIRKVDQIKPVHDTARGYGQSQQIWTAWMAKSRHCTCRACLNRLLLVATKISSSRHMAIMKKLLSRPMYCHVEEVHQATITRGTIMLHSSARCPWRVLYTVEHLQPRFAITRLLHVWIPQGSAKRL